MLWGALLLIAAWPEPPVRHAACEQPWEVASIRGHTTAVRCAGEPERSIRGPARLLFDRKLDPNCADAATLTALPGIGPGLAGAIVEARRSEPFEGVADVRRVRGIGPGRLARIRDALAVAEAGCVPLQ